MNLDKVESINMDRKEYLFSFEATYLFAIDRDAESSV
jgi:hypothetical protein